MINRVKGVQDPEDGVQAAKDGSAELDAGGQTLPISMVVRPVAGDDLPVSLWEVDATNGLEMLQLPFMDAVVCVLGTGWSDTLSRVATAVDLSKVITRPCRRVYCRELTLAGWLDACVCGTEYG